MAEGPTKNRKVELVVLTPDYKSDFEDNVV